MINSLSIFLGGTINMEYYPLVRYNHQETFSIFLLILCEMCVCGKRAFRDAKRHYNMTECRNGVDALGIDYIFRLL